MGNNVGKESDRDLNEQIRIQLALRDVDRKVAERAYAPGRESSTTSTGTPPHVRRLLRDGLPVI